VSRIAKARLRYADACRCRSILRCSFDSSGRPGEHGLPGPRPPVVLPATVARQRVLAAGRGDQGLADQLRVIGVQSVGQPRHALPGPRPPPRPRAVVAQARAYPAAAVQATASRAAGTLAQADETRRQWRQLTEPTRQVALAADRELRRRYPQQATRREAAWQVPEPDGPGRRILWAWPHGTASRSESPASASRLALRRRKSTSSATPAYRMRTPRQRCWASLDLHGMAPGRAHVWAGRRRPSARSSAIIGRLVPSLSIRAPRVASKTGFSVAHARGWLAA
jgi:hypothetical protein